MRINVRQAIVLFTNILLLGGCFIGLLLFWNVSIAPESWCIYISWIAGILMCYQIIVMIMLKYKYYEFVPWFIVLQFVFLYGRIFVKAIGHDQDISWRLFNAYSDLDCFKAALFCIVYSQAIFTGIILGSRIVGKAKKNRNKNKVVIENDKYNSNAMAFIGWGILILTFPIKLYTNIQTILAQRVYQAYSISGDYNGVILVFGYIPTAGLILLMCSKKYSKRTVIFGFVLYFIYELFYMIFSGDRRQEVISLIVLVLCFCKLYGVKIKIRVLIPALVVAFIGLTFLAAIRSGRGDVVTSVSQYNSTFQKMLGNNILVETLGEFGGTFFTVVSTVAFYPKINSYACGLTYIASVLIIIPGLMTDLFPDVFLYGSISAACKRITGQPLGGSLCMDMYGNFGLLGGLFAIVLGCVIGRLFVSYFYNKQSNYQIANYYIFFFIILNGVRAGIYELTRPLAYTFIMIWAFAFVYRRISKRGKVKVEKENGLAEI